MYEQHPVPQQISSYQFRLVGDMTLKQFFQLAGGAVVALIIYSLPLPALLRWPLVIMAALSGAAFAFLPIQDRPLEQWLAAFFKSIYTPTIYVWQRRQTSPQYFQPEGTALPPTESPQVIAQVQTQQVAAGPPEPEYIENLEKGEEERLKEIAGLMQNGRHETSDQETVISEQKIDSREQIVESSSPATDHGSLITDHPVIAPRLEKVVLEHKGYEAPQETREIQTSQVKQVFSASGESGTVQAAQFSSSAAPPNPPTQPNILVGQVIDSSGKIIEGAILEIKDVEGRPVRALKTNKVGHFMIVTPLSDGEYKIIIEKEGYEFAPIEIAVKGEIVEPIAIRAK